ncbi:unannotated protein [freshwater metagenome]|uniref:Unannotated protein n=1 Tax=freshwater metagenome TaxID=449393 RepID=A0A6J7DQ84_9ZZZZ
MGEGLGVLHEGRTAVHAPLERARPVHRRGLAVARPVGQGALLAGDIAGRRRDELDPNRVGASLLEHAVEHGHERRAAVHGQVGICRADRRGRRLDAVEHEVRGVREQHGVLAARRLALHGIGDHHRLSSGRQGPAGVRALDHRVHLACGREPASPAAAQHRAVQFVDEGPGAPVAGGFDAGHWSEGRFVGRSRAQVADEAGSRIDRQQTIGRHG